jgi:hypothetical protein
MDDVLPGIRHWTAFRETLGTRVSSYYVEPAGVLIDPMIPEEGGIEALAALPVGPEQIILTNRRHRRHSSEIASALDIPVRVPAKAMAQFADEPRARRYEDRDEVAPGITAVVIGKIAPDETVLYLAHERGAIAFGDSLTRHAGVLGFFSDELLGAHPQRKQAGLRDAFRGLLVRDFDALLFAHGDPKDHGGKEALREFTEQPVGYPEFGSTL